MRLVYLFSVQDLVVVIHNVLSNLIILYVFAEVFIIDHMFFLLGNVTLNVFTEARKLFTYFDERLFLVFENCNICMSNQIVLTALSEENGIMIDHLSWLKVSLCFLVHNNTVHDEVYKFWRLTSFGDECVFLYLLSLELFKVLWIEAFISARQEFSMDQNSITIHVLGKFSLQCAWQYLKKISHLLISFKFVTCIALKIVSNLLHKLEPNIKLLIKLINFIEFLFVTGSLLGDFTELSTQITKEVTEDSNTTNDDNHCPCQLVVVCWQDVSIADGSACNCCPIKTVSVLIQHAAIFDSSFRHPVDIWCSVTKWCGVPEASSSMNCEEPLEKGNDNVLVFLPKLSFLEIQFQIVHSKSGSW